MLIFELVIGMLLVDVVRSLFADRLHMPYPAYWPCGALMRWP